MPLWKLSIGFALTCGLCMCASAPTDKITISIIEKVSKLHVGMSRKEVLSTLKPKSIQTLPGPSTELFVFEGALYSGEPVVWMAVEFGRTQESPEIILTRKPDEIQVSRPGVNRVIKIHF